MQKIRLLSVILILALLASLCCNTVLAEEETLPALPETSDYVITEKLQLTNATDILTTTKAKSGTRLKAQLLEESFDISQYDYLYLWIYVSDDTVLYDNNGDGLELASGGKEDQEENALYFYYNKATVPTINENYHSLKTGWNEYLLKISDFKVTAGGSLDHTVLNYIGLVLRSNPAGLTFAMSEIYAVKEENVTRTSMGTFGSDSGIPAIPVEDARYQLADTALQLTGETASATAANSNKHFRLTPALTAQTLDISGYDYIYLWVYVAYDDLAAGDSIELCSGGAQDKEENAARFNSLTQGKLHTGWNELLIPISEFSYESGGGLDSMALNFIGIVLRSAANVQTGAVSYIYAVKEDQITDTACPITEEIPTDSARYTLKDSALALTKEPVWGSETDGYIRLAPALTQASFDLSEYDYIYTWIYITADDLAAGDSIELCSGGAQDKEENAVRFNTWNYDSLKPGWNEVMVSVDEFVYSTGGELNIAKLNFIGVVLRSQSGEQTAMVSQIYALKSVDFVDTQPSDDPLPTGNGKINRGEVIHDFAEETAAKTNGVLSMETVLAEPVQPAYYDYICVEIYIENKALLSRQEAYLTISSSEAADVQELSYRLTKQPLQEGWNTVFLPIEDFRMSGYDYDDANYGGICDLLDVCRIGVSWAIRAESEEAEPVLKLGEISLTNSLVTAQIPEGKYVLTDSAVQLTKGEVSTTVTAGSNAQLARLMPEINYGDGYYVDISGKQYLYFWLYVSNAEADDSTVSDNELELASGGKCDEEENAIRLYRIDEEGEPYLMSGDYGSFETGWNEYMIPIEDLTRLTNKSGEAGIGCDMACVNYLRIFFHTMAGAEAEEISYAISTVYAINPADLSGEGASVPDLNPAPTEETTDTPDQDSTQPTVPHTGDSGFGPAGLMPLGCLAVLILIAAPQLKKRRLQ